MARCLGLLIACVVVTNVFAQQRLRFEVASVKPNVSDDRSITFRPDPADGFFRTNNPLDSIIRYAYDLQDFRVVGVPEWARNDRFDIAAKAAGRISDPERRLMVRALLADRFRMKSHFEMREHTVYLMTPSRTDKRLGPGLKPRPECEGAPTPCQSGGTGRQDGIVIRAITLKQLAEGMISAVRRELVLDETGIAGVFDVEMSFRPDTSTDPADARPAFVTAMQEQLGLKLEPTRRQIEVLVIDSIERPTPD
ncbi:MAG TPA: TIGR03435 family protein [Vicinamibacterales bacterium]